MYPFLENLSIDEFYFCPIILPFSEPEKPGIQLSQIKTIAFFCIITVVINYVRKFFEAYIKILL